MSAEAEVRTKIGIRILPFLFLLYVVAFLDRINIGFAALTMNKELAISSQQFGLVVGMFFFGYFLLEIPSNLILHRIGARVWIARILVTWGFVAIATAFAQDVAQLYAARFLLGVAESGFFPGILFYLTYWFRQREQARAIALFMIAQPVTNILGAPVSGMILDRVHWLHLSSWRWLLILEGLPAIIFGIATYLLLPSRPEQATFLTPLERDGLASALAEERAQKTGGRHLSVLDTLSNGRVWHLAVIGFTQAIGAYTLIFWMPQVVKALSSVYSNTTVGMLVAIPHLVGLVAMIAVSRSSDRRLERRFHLAIPLAIAGAAFLSLRAVHSTTLSILLLSFVAFGVYGFFGPYFASASAFLSGASAAVGIAVITSVANLGGFVGPYMVGLLARTTEGMNVGLALAGVSLLASATLALLLPERTLVTA